MKDCFILFAAVLTVSCSIAEPIPTDHYDPNAEVSERRAVIKSIAIRTPKNAPEDVLSVAEAGLSDPDSKVREYALAIILRLAVAPRYYPGTPKIDLTQFSALKERLLDLLEDKEEKVRQIAIEAIGVSFDPNPELETLFIERFKEETSGANRKRIVQCLAQHKYDSFETIALLRNALTDEHSEVKGDAAKRIAEIKPSEALPLLIQGMTTEDQFVRERFARAIKAYGRDAVPYLPKLEQMKEQANDASRELLDRTIKAVRNEESGSVHDD